VSHFVNKRNASNFFLYVNILRSIFVYEKNARGRFLKIVQLIVALYGHVFSVIGIKNTKWHKRTQINELLLTAEHFTFRRKKHRRKKLEIVFIKADPDPELLFQNPHLAYTAKNVLERHAVCLTRAKLLINIPDMLSVYVKNTELLMRKFSTHYRRKLRIFSVIVKL
jgi:hypothetical protein